MNHIKKIWCKLFHCSLTWPNKGKSVCTKCQMKWDITFLDVNK